MNFSRGGVPGATEQYRIHVYEDTIKNYNSKREPAEQVPEDADGVTPGELRYGQEGVCVIFFEDSVRHLKSRMNALTLLPSTIAHEVGHAVGLGHHYEYAGMSIKPPKGKGEACVMISSSGILDFLQHVDWSGSGYADFHDDGIHGAHAAEWEDHWGAYQLHDNYLEHRSY